MYPEPDTSYLDEPQSTAGIPEWLDEITMRCIDKNRAGRYQNIGEIFSDLLASKSRE